MSVERNSDTKWGQNYAKTVFIRDEEWGKAANREGVQHTAVGLCPWWVRGAES